MIKNSVKYTVITEPLGWLPISAILSAATEVFAKADPSWVETKNP
jgi:hypothetical protein